MKKKTYHRTLQLATVVKKQYSKKKIKFLKEEKISLNGYSWVCCIHLGSLK